MNRIITTSELQKGIGQIAKEIDEKSYIVTSHGKGKVVMLPYFDGCDQLMIDYMEDYEMAKNRVALTKRYEESAASRESDLII